MTNGMANAPVMRTEASGVPRIHQKIVPLMEKVVTHGNEGIKEQACDDSACVSLLKTQKRKRKQPKSYCKHRIESHEKSGAPSLGILTQASVYHALESLVEAVLGKRILTGGAGG